MRLLLLILPITIAAALIYFFDLHTSEALGHHGRIVLGLVTGLVCGIMGVLLYLINVEWGGEGENTSN